MCTFSLLILLFVGASLTTLAQQPFEQFGVKVKVLSLSNGHYPEFFANDSLRRVGSVVYNRRLHRIAYLLPPDSLVSHPKPEVASRWLSPDPLAYKFSHISPYAYVENNPLNYVDPDGRSGIATIDKNNHTITISSNMILYGSAANTQLAKSTAADVENAWNAANGTVKIGNEVYNVRFKITGSYVNYPTKDEVDNNKSAENNYIKVSDCIDGNISYMDAAGSNTGEYLTKNIQAECSTTEGHEMGHGYGEEHTSDNLIGQGTPSIMAARGTKVDAKFQYDPKASPGSRGGTVNPETRKVSQADIDNLGLDKLQFDKQNKANVGGLTNTIH